MYLSALVVAELGVLKHEPVDLASATLADGCAGSIAEDSVGAAEAVEVARAAADVAANEDFDAASAGIALESGAGLDIDTGAAAGDLALHSLAGSSADNCTAFETVRGTAEGVAVH